MKVYVVYEDEFEEVLAVFSTEEKAINFATKFDEKRENTCYYTEILEFEVDEEN